MGEGCKLLRQPRGGRRGRCSGRWTVTNRWKTSSYDQGNDKSFYTKASQYSNECPSTSYKRRRSQPKCSPKSYANKVYREEGLYEYSTPQIG